jgi:hypothetical protein
LPTDFDSPWDENSFVLIDSNGGYIPLDFSTSYDQDLISNPAITGTPQTALVNLESMTWRPYPLPGTGYTWQVRYKYKPTRVASYANHTPVFPNDQIIIQALFVDGLQHEDDDRYVREMAVLTQMISRYKAKFNLQPQKKSRVRFSPRFSTPTNFR